MPDMGCHVSGVFFCLSLLILITNVFDIMIEKETHRMSRQENEKNPQPKAGSIFSPSSEKSKATNLWAIELNPQNTKKSFHASP